MLYGTLDWKWLLGVCASFVTLANQVGLLGSVHGSVHDMSADRVERGPARGGNVECLLLTEGSACPNRLAKGGLDGFAGNTAAAAHCIEKVRAL